MDEKRSVKLLVTFAESGKGKVLEKWYIKQGIICSYFLKGTGTASSELLDVLGLGSPDKDILLSLVSKDSVEWILNKIESGTVEETFGKGIVFDMPLSGLNSIVATVINGQNIGGVSTDMNKGADYSLILVTVNQGHTDQVMDTAREAGANGGTVIRARWAGDKDVPYLYGISVQAEKEIIAIVTTNDKRNAIMEMINKIHGLKSEAGAVICSIGLDHAIRLA